MCRLASLLLALTGCAAPAHVQHPSLPASGACHAQTGVTLQVLGSGGPIPDDERASAGYLVWVEGKARALIDAGGGTFVRFGQAGASLDDLEVVALSHLHTDHSAELPGFLKGTYFGSRQRNLLVVGPSGAGPFPSLGDFLRSMFGPGGAYAYLGWLLRDGEGSFSLAPVEIDRSAREPRAVAVPGMQFEAIGVEHGPVPALGFRVRVGEKTLVLSGDQNGNNPAFVELARGADVLVMHLAIPEDAGPGAAGLHARPSEIATVARQAGVRTLVLSHFMHRSLVDLDRALTLIASDFDGEVIIANDLTCVVP